MGLISKLFGAKKNAEQRPAAHEVEVHFFYGSTNFQYLFALDDVLRHSISAANVGVYEGHDISEDGNDGTFYFYGPDAEAIQRAITPLLADSSFMRGATLTMWFGPKKRGTPKRVIHLPA